MDEHTALLLAEAGELIIDGQLVTADDVTDAGEVPHETEADEAPQEEG